MFSEITDWEDIEICQVDFVFAFEPEFFALESRPFAGRGRISDEDLEKGAAAATRHSWRKKVYKSVFGFNQKGTFDEDQYFFGNSLTAFGFNVYLQKRLHQDSQIAVMGGKAVLHGRNDDVQPMAEKYGLTTESTNMRERTLEKNRAADGTEKAFDMGESDHVRDAIVGLLSWGETFGEDEMMTKCLDLIETTSADNRIKFLKKETEHTLENPRFVKGSKAWQNVCLAWKARDDARKALAQQDLNAGVDEAVENAENIELSDDSSDDSNDD